MQIILLQIYILNFEVCRDDCLGGSVVAFKEETSVIVHVDDAAGFFDGAFSAIAVLIGAVVVYDDGATGADKLVHAFPGFDPGANAEGFELPDGAFEIPDKRLQKLFAVDGMPENSFERCDGSIQVRIVAWLAIDVDADSHRERWARCILLYCHPRLVRGSPSCINDLC